MSGKKLERRDFIKTILGGAAVLALDWNSFPKGLYAKTDSDEYDAIIIGAGLGGLSCAAGFARQGFKVLVIEQHNKAGGYATTFKRPGGFVFDASLHSTTTRERNGIYNMIPGFPEITEVEFLPHPELYRVIYPDYDIRVPQKDVEGYIEILCGYFPEEKENIIAIVNDMKGIANDIGKLTSAKGNVDMKNFPAEFPHLFNCYTKSWGQVVDQRIKDPKLKAIISAQWVYYGLPPSKLSSFYYAMPAIGYLQGGGYYPRGKSQSISNALVKFIKDNGGKVKLNTRVDQILTKDQTAYGIKTEKGEEFKSKVVVSNANVFSTFNKMMNEAECLKEYQAKWNQYSVSVSSFQVFLGLKEDLIGKLNIKDSEIFYENSYDMDASYESIKNADLENGGFAITLYDNVCPNYSPEGKNTINIMTLQGYDHWEKYEKDYFAGNKDAYKAEKKRMADILIKHAEEKLLPGLTEVIEVIEIGTPLTNIRYTDNFRGAVYGWDQTMNNSGPNRLGHSTPVKNLYLAGAWTKPGHGYGGVLWSGLECFGEIMGEWKKG